MSAVVRRITIDERLADDLIRVAICPLKNGVNAFLDREGDWGAERQSFIRPKDYVRKLGIPDPGDWPWESLSEGMVFLSGAFEFVPKTRPDGEVELAYFQISKHRGRFERIDHLDVIRESIHQLYAHALGGGK
jgi:hypothetical protein